MAESNTRDIRKENNDAEKEPLGCKKSFGKTWFTTVSKRRRKLMFTPEVVQVIPHENYLVEILFQDGKIVYYDASQLLEKGFLSG